jgi:hypothetical protein
VLPPPDFDPISGFLKNKAYHDSPWSYGVHHPDVIATNISLPISDDDFQRFQKLQLLRRYYRIFNNLPGRLHDTAVEFIRNNEKSKLSKFPTKSPEKLNDEEIDQIDIENAGVWEYRNTTSSDYYSDKSCPPNSRDLNNIKDGTEYYSLPITERNFLMFYLSSSNYKNTLEIMTENNQGMKQQVAHFKPESKKPDPRNFFSAKPHARLAMSEWETNVEKYLNKDIAAFISKDPNEKALALKTLLGGDFFEKDAKVVYISFDLDKWSPRFSIEGKKASTRIWSKFF